MSVIEGVPGPLESSVYASAVEQPEALPAASVAVARRFVVWFSGTGVVIPAPPKLAALPVASGEPVQVAVE